MRAQSNENVQVSSLAHTDAPLLPTCCLLPSNHFSSLLSCSSVRIKAFCPKYDRLWLLRKYRQEKSIMGLSFDNNSKFLQTTGWFLSFSTPLALFGRRLQEKIHCSSTCTYERRPEKIPHALSQLQRGLSGSLMPPSLTSDENDTLVRLH